MCSAPNFHVVVVGGGIAGGALATALAGAGCRVTVLEATTEFSDRVRGESIMPWGVAEAARLGVDVVVRRAGAHTASTWLRWSEGCREPRPIPVGLVVPGIAGTLNLEHRRACQALLDAAADAGATVVRGVGDVRVRPGDWPSVSFAGPGASERAELEPDLVIGADGRSSRVRRDCGIALETQAATGFIAGLLLDDVEGNDGSDLVAEHELGLFLLLHQPGRRARAYHVVSDEHRSRFTGADGPSLFLRDAGASNDVVAHRLAAARPAGPCAAHPGTDTWTDRPLAPGVVLIGDAAGHNDPTAGCGLSIALRDARLVRDLVLTGARRPADFEPYARERAERMRRLRLIADLLNAASVEPAANRTDRRAFFASAMSAMDPTIFPLVLGMFAGPETVPDDAVDPTVLDRVRAA